MKILFVRHGEPDYSIDSLTEKGWREAELLADRLCREPAADYYVSPLGRARDTARATLERLGRTAETLDWLQEFRGTYVDPMTGARSYAWDLMPQYWTRCPELYSIDTWRDNALYQTGDSGAIYDETAAGLDALLERYGYRREGHFYRTEKNTDATIVLFCHFGISMVMLSHLLGVSPVLLTHGFLMAPASITTLVTEERLPGEVWFRCVGLGDTGHLYAAGEHESYSGRFHEVYGADEGYESK